MERRDSEENELVIDEDANSSPEDESPSSNGKPAEVLNNKKNHSLLELPQIQNIAIQLVPITETRPPHTPRKTKKTHSSKVRKEHSTLKDSSPKNSRKLQSFRLDTLKSFKSTSLSVSNSINIEISASCDKTGLHI